MATNVNDSILISNKEYLEFQGYKNRCKELEELIEKQCFDKAILTINFMTNLYSTFHTYSTCFSIMNSDISTEVNKVVIPMLDGLNSVLDNNIKKMPESKLEKLWYDIKGYISKL